ncbi:MAG: tol-pal system protein YbgF [Deltaproteobacteria bacterium]|nr:tol-pal system protein YbgF [Deltaproteobacteria bacterium]
MGIHVLLKPTGIRLVLFLSCLLFFFSCVTEDKFLYLSKRIDTIEAKTDKELVSNSERMATNSAEMDQLKEEMRFLNGRLDENSHLLKRSIERDTTTGDSLGEGVSELRERMTRLELRVDRISTYLGLEPMIQPQNKDVLTAPVPQVRKPATPTTQPEPKVKLPPDQTLYDVNMDIYRKEKYEEAIVGFKNFLKKYPKSKLADNAAFWIGESYMALKQYEQAILSFQKVIKKYPRGNKVPNATLRQALAFYELNDKTSAKLLLRKLIKKYPKSNEAKIARSKLKTMK